MISTSNSLPARIMGVLNVTPDSFYDGGQYNSPTDAIDRARQMVDEGADIIDVGGESTRPGALPVDDTEQIRRTAPVIEGVRRFWDGHVSIDTTRAEVACAAFESGANWVNDISALRDDPAMVEFVAHRDCQVILMHMRGIPRTMQEAPEYENVGDSVLQFLSDRAAFAIGSGIDRTQIILDPGIGFGKTVEHNLELMRRLPEIVALGYPVLIGLSRKSLIGTICGSEADERLEGSLIGAVTAVRVGVSIIRVHDVASTRRALRMALALGEFVDSSTPADTIQCNSI